MLPDGEASSIKEFCEENSIQYIHIDTEEYDVDCIPSKEEKNRVVSVRKSISTYGDTHF